MHWCDDGDLAGRSTGSLLYGGMQDDNHEKSRCTE